MKKIALLLLFVLTSFLVGAQTYVGTITIGSYTRENVTADVVIKNNVGTAVLHNVKFSKFMPITLDVTMGQVKVTKVGEKLVLSGNNIIPTVKGKSFEGYKITNFSGTIVSGVVTASCMMDGKKLTYKGKLKK